jgi:hypothetical protein
LTAFVEELGPFLSHVELAKASFAGHKRALQSQTRKAAKETGTKPMQQRTVAW